MRLTLMPLSQDSPRVAARVDEEHEREEPSDLRVVRERAMDLAREPYRLAREIDP